MQTVRMTPTQMFSCEYCTFFDNTCFEGHLHTSAPDNNNKTRFLGKATGRNDDHMVSVGGQRLKIGGN